MSTYYLEYDTDRAGTFEVCERIVVTARVDVRADGALHYNAILTLDTGDTSFVRLGLDAFISPRYRLYAFPSYSPWPTCPRPR